MKILIKKFGEILISRSDGREAYFAMSSSILKNVSVDEEVEIDFLGVRVLTPGWADEVVTKIAERFKNVKLINTENSSVQATLKTLREYSDLKI
ncbi:MAG: hypothetical protein US83_C0004G0113 [Candidatus Falkowbacteria bacterium GW2011_GWC2_38_22]|uniref:DUF4325 domain-containing protein n=1 Tax=Candidatus Falkowbacteria bacterium GW2011_GWE1_38_31 TaxID=1618638 RepID=A0A0G0M9Z5_9BACT|nr:MAG: hypothetical protein US73_C0002G0004 [Candidatus Falkowbacteria bacterium GW2011_GWF2_38_1205]KKQ61729.1 MAG: hypothetical protein US83_C0004G0113 [Candidatus Falkowbacteria bacterium GW2011_GWC2_38_22]KKQ63656.1 MAG: hypothetical protein US84_C0004G0004 [Candidatus Falkowbacteria bacterium GW2011_GWF1_38_22]KKQ65928.1 MAG: hypothetical protein US87_C0004G0113 [Candidatus Falkowbacteria bacterium GW2011_GWE2_38_254]KKQ70519.1 MAG: hypothetical protein US91_C0004G0004 [Candidatus Falkowb